MAIVDEVVAVSERDTVSQVMTVSARLEAVAASHHTFEGDLSGSWATRIRNNTVVDVEKGLTTHPWTE